MEHLTILIDTSEISYLSAVEALRKALNKISPLGEESVGPFLQAWQQRDLPRNYELLQEGKISTHFYFIETGVARIYYHKNNKEITEWLATGGEFFMSITSFFEQKPSHLAIHTLQSSKIWGIHHDDLMALCDKYHDVERLMRKMLTRSLILSQVRMYSIQFEPALQRYNQLLEQFPQIIQQVPLTYIASFLGITLETLSRIRSQK